MQMMYMLIPKGVQEMRSAVIVEGVIGAKGLASNVDRAMQEGVHAPGSTMAMEQEGPVMRHPSNAVACAERAQRDVKMSWSVMFILALIPPSS